MYNLKIVNFSIGFSLGASKYWLLLFITYSKNNQHLHIRLFQASQLRSYLSFNSFNQCDCRIQNIGLYFLPGFTHQSSCRSVALRSYKSWKGEIHPCPKKNCIHLNLYARPRFELDFRILFTLSDKTQKNS